MYLFLQHVYLKGNTMFTGSKGWREQVLGKRVWVGKENGGFWKTKRVLGTKLFGNRTVEITKQVGSGGVSIGVNNCWTVELKEP